MTTQSLKEKTAKGLFWGGLSNGTQQLLNLVFGILLSRLLTADDYGMVGMLTIFSLIAGSLQESGFTAALANKREITHDDYNAVFWFSIGMSSCLYCILFFCAPWIANFYNVPELTSLARYAFLGFFISSLGTAQSAYLFRNLMVKQKAITSIIAVILSGGIGVLLAYNGFAYWGLATQSLVFSSTISICYWIFSPWRPSFTINFAPLKGMIGFSGKLLLTNIFNHINNNFFSVVFGKYYSKQTVGYYNQANKWNNMGYSFITSMITGVAQPVLVQVADDKMRQQMVFRKMLRFTAFLSFPLMFGLSLIAHELIIITITDRWIESAGILQILCLGGAFIPIQNLYSNLLISKNRSQTYMYNTIALGLLQLSSVLLLHPYGIYAMIIIYVIINISWLLVWHYFVWREINLSIWSVSKDILPFTGIAAITMIVTWLLTNNISNIYLMLSTKIISAAIIYVSILWICKATVLQECITYLFHKHNS